MSESYAKLQEALRAKVLREDLHSSNDVVAGTYLQNNKSCWLCGAEVSLRFRLKDNSALCFVCFRLAYVALVLPQIDTSERRCSDSALLARLEEIHGEEDGEDIFDPSQASFVMSASVMLTRSRHSASASERHAVPHGGGHRGTGTQSTAAGQFWGCPGCTFINPLNGKSCEACGFVNPGTVVCDLCGVKCSIAIADNPNPCRNGQRHLVWRCAECSYLNCLDDDKCGTCGKARYWACTYCTAQHSQERSQDGLRYCSTCGSYNTPEDVISGQVKVDAEQHRAGLVSPKIDAHLPDDVLSDVIFGVNDADTLAERERQREITKNELRLQERLRKLQIHREIQKTDGNCLFAALAHQLFGNAALHGLIRSLIVAYMKRNSQDYQVLFDGDGAFKQYTSRMRENGYWGDELCLNAAARCFRVNIHVITSEPFRWHLAFQHAQLGESVSILQPQPSLFVTESITVGGQLSSTQTRGLRNILRSPRQPPTEPCLFLTYLSPVHYDDITPSTVRTIVLSDLLMPELHKMLASEDDARRRHSAMPRLCSTVGKSVLPRPKGSESVEGHSKGRTVEEAPKRVSLPTLPLPPRLPSPAHETATSTVTKEEMLSKKSHQKSWL